MSKHKDGGPAFPRPAFTPGLSGQHDKPAEAGFANTESQGMSLRDWFAGQALQGMLSYPQTPVSAATMAVASYVLADAMLAARKAKL